MKKAGRLKVKIEWIYIFKELTVDSREFTGRIIKERHCFI